MTFHSVLRRIQKTKQAYDDALKAVGRGLRKELAAYLSGALPDGIAIEWTQCTPSYNDGEPCRFRAHPPAMFQAAPDDEMFPDDAFYIDSTYRRSVPGLTKGAVRSFIKAWKSLPPALLEKAFGDGARVRVHSNGSITVHDYLGD